MDSETGELLAVAPCTQIVNADFPSIQSVEVFFFFLSSLCQRFLSAAAACGKTLAISNFKCFEPPFGNLVIFSFQTFLLSFLNNVPLSQCDCKTLALINSQ